MKNIRWGKTILTGITLGYMASMIYLAMQIALNTVK